MRGGKDSPPNRGKECTGRAPDRECTRVVVFMEARTVMEKMGPARGQERENPWVATVKGMVELTGRGVEGQVKVKVGGVYVKMLAGEVRMGSLGDTKPEEGVTGPREDNGGDRG